MESITENIDGASVTGSWTINKDEVVVRYKDRIAHERFGPLDPEETARGLLRAMYANEKLGPSSG